MSAEEFAPREGFKPGTLRWWAGELRRLDRATPSGASKSKPAGTPALARVVTKPAAHAAASGLVIRTGGVDVLVTATTDRALLGDVLDALRRSAG